MKTEISETDAIRQVLREGAAGDYCDVAELVRQKFGLHVGAALVERVAIALKQESASGPTVQVGPIGVDLSHGITGPGSSGSAAPAESRSDAAGHPGTDRVLEFVQAMGGFEAARNAVTDLENSLKKLMR